MSNLIEAAGWTVNWKMTEAAGLAIYLADYRGRRMVWEATLPYLSVDHQRQDVTLDDAAVPTHGPIASPLGFRSLAGEVNTNFFHGGFELTADFVIGPSAYTQMWRFHDDGRLAPWLTIHGNCIHAAHTYHPHWRFDFDVDGAEYDALERFDGERWVRVQEEGWFPYTGATDQDGTAWRQVDSRSGAAISIRPHQWEDAELYAIRYHDYEFAETSPHIAATTFPSGYVGSKPLDSQDITLWYVAHVHYDDAFPFTAGPWLKVSGID